MNKLVQWTSSGLLVLVASFGIFVLLGPRLLGLQFMTVLSPSMSPSIDMGAVVVVRPVDAQAIQEGDVITFRSPEDPRQIVTHRVIEALGKGITRSFRTQGDANDAPDREHVSAGLILGQVIFHLPLLGYLVRFVRTPTGFLAIVGVPALLIVGGEVRQIARLLQEKPEDTSESEIAAAGQR
jgi:signal peptidase